MFKKIEGGRELVPGRELVHHHYSFCDLISSRSLGPVDTCSSNNQRMYMVASCVDDLTVASFCGSNSPAYMTNNKSFQYNWK